MGHSRQHPNEPPPRMYRAGVRTTALSHFAHGQPGGYRRPSLELKQYNVAAHRRIFILVFSDHTLRDEHPAIENLDLNTVDRPRY
jgi:hypothetical protein